MAELSLLAHRSPSDRRDRPAALIAVEAAPDGVAGCTTRGLCRRAAHGGPDLRRGRPGPRLGRRGLCRPAPARPNRPARRAVRWTDPSRPRLTLRCAHTEAPTPSAAPPRTIGPAATSAGPPQAPAGARRAGPEGHDLDQRAGERQLRQPGRRSDRLVDGLGRADQVVHAVQLPLGPGASPPRRRAQDQRGVLGQLLGQDPQLRAPSAAATAATSRPSTTSVATTVTPMTTAVPADTSAVKAAEPRPDMALVPPTAERSPITSAPDVPATCAARRSFARPPCRPAGRGASGPPGPVPSPWSDGV